MKRDFLSMYKKDIQNECWKLILYDLEREIAYIKTINNYQDFDGEWKQCIWVEHLERQLNEHLIKKYKEKLK